MDSNGLRALIAASVAGLLAAIGAHGIGREAQAAGEERASVNCYGINKCQGTGDCGGKTHSCHAQNACKGQGYLSMNEDDCLRIEGGRLTETAQDAAQKAG